jgi:PAS domain S-box-containing protein
MSLETLKVLQIDSDAAEHGRCRALLNRVQTVRYDIDWTRTADEGWQLINERRHDVYLIADRLGPDNGIDLIRRVRAHAFAVGPLILVLGTSNESLDIEALAAGAADCLAKDDLSAASLDRAIRHAIQRQRIMQELKDTEARFNLALGAANLGFWDWNFATGEIGITPEYKRMLGYAESATVFSSQAEWWDAIHPDDRGLVEQVINRLAESATTTASAVYRLREKSGSYRWIQDRMAAVYDGQRHLVRVFGISVDVTERKQDEERLREQAAVLDQANDGVIVHALDHRVAYCNRSAARSLGLTPEEVVGHIAQELGRFPPQYDQAFEHVLQHGAWHGELIIKRRDGSSIVTDSRWTLLRDDAGRPTAVLTFYIDITEKKRLEAQFLRAQRMESIGMLAGGIAHDLNNVLAPIVMGTQLLKLRHSDSESLKLLDAIAGSAQRGAELVRQVLTFARGTEDQHFLVHPKVLVRDVKEILTGTIGNSIEVVTHIDNDLWPVHGDFSQLHQLLMNLCVNARDAMPQGGRLALEVRNVRIDEQYAAMSPEARPGLFVVFEVRDTGLGIPPEIRDRIFEPFFSTKGPGKGTGLGLATVQTIVKNHEGFIALESEVGRGTAFKVYLPASAETAEARGTATGAPPPRGNGETILVVDDEASILSITRHALELFGYEALTASNGAEALALFAQKQGKIAAVLTDMAMPVLDGAALIYALRKIDPDVKVIAASGLKSSVQSMEPFGLGATSFLAKPFTAEIMLHTIHETLASRGPVKNESPAAVPTAPF